jgi:hypothetical protein
MGWLIQQFNKLIARSGLGSSTKNLFVTGRILGTAMLILPAASAGTRLIPSDFIHLVSSQVLHQSERDCTISPNGPDIPEVVPVGANGECHEALGEPAIPSAKRDDLATTTRDRAKLRMRNHAG